MCKICISVGAVWYDHTPAEDPPQFQRPCQCTTEETLCWPHQNLQAHQWGVCDETGHTHTHTEHWTRIHKSVVTTKTAVKLLLKTNMLQSWKWLAQTVEVFLDNKVNKYMKCLPSECIWYQNNISWFIISSIRGHWLILSLNHSGNQSFFFIHRCTIRRKSDELSKSLQRTAAPRKREKSTMMAMMMTTMITLLKMEKSGWTAMR